MEKRGELTTTQIAVILFAIVSFVIVLIFIFQFWDSGQVTQKELCHLSVVTRGSSPESAQSYVPLKCSTQKTCLYEGDEKCKYSFAGEKTEEIKLDKEDSKAAEQIAETSALAMYDCWQMMGEGKIDLFHSAAVKYGFSAADSACVICSRIALDAGSRNDLILSKVDLPEYLQTHQPPEREDGQTYLQVFTDKTVSSYTKINAETFDAAVDKNPVISEFETRENNPEMAVVFMQIKPPEYSNAFSSLASAGATGVVSGFVLAPKAAVTGLGWAAKGILRLPVVAAVAGAAGAGYITMNVHAGQVAAAGYCGEVTVPGGGNAKVLEVYEGNKTKASNGCSMVQVVPYDAKAINKLCSHIESSP